MLALVAGVAIALGALAWVLWPVVRPGPAPAREVALDAAPASPASAMPMQVVCPVCGPRPEPDARVCSTCGRVLRDKD